VGREALAEPAGQVVRVALAEPVDPVVLAVLVVPVVLENPAVQVVPENPAVQELGPVGAVRVLVQAAPPARIKWAIAAHHHGQVRAPKRVEALAAVAAATMHVRAATEAATAWEAAE